MTRTHGLALSMFLALAVANPAMAQFNRTAVSINGNDANLCTVVSPCRSFDRAILQTNSGGEVVALDSGGYGPFTVTKAVSVIAAPGAYAGITVPSGGTGILVAAAPGDTVVIQGLTIRGIPGQSLAFGIKYDSGSALHVDHCVIGKFNAHGIFAGLSANGSLFVANTLVLGVDIGIYFSTSSGTIKGSVTSTRVEGVGNAAYYVSDNARVTINHSLASASGVGYRVLMFLGTTAELNVDDSVSSNNSIGVLLDSASGTTTFRASNMTITNNTTGISISAGGTKNALSYGNNRVAGNTTPGAFTGTISQQ